ncbi:serine/threonine-protein phosphatase 4 regulatory subunit 2 [Achroia grisella]|uniref:serine/threonine-protein phosphatase 4 regulatory subunit 2 n=1 Tax=Achroia grisella TaxID=688607 RepID=UPI0027D22358|nr:serine/threonine-protein phosphatase 4 regulatory subunit 2 [Achroia grisella]
MNMENAEEIFHFLEEFSKRKSKNIPQELNDYLAYVARTGDPVYQWSLVKCLFKEKLLNAITDFYDTAPGLDIPPYPNVDPFNYDTMKNSLLERLDSFSSAPFTVQRISELLTCPRKQYNRVDKFMRAIEKNILVVSTREPGIQRHVDPDNVEPMEPIVNGSDNNSECNVDVEMEDMSWKENIDQPQNSEPQPGSSDAHISIEDIEARLKAKKDSPVDIKAKIDPQYESVTPPELNVSPDIPANETKNTLSNTNVDTISSIDDETKIGTGTNITEPNIETKTDVEMATEDTVPHALVIPEIKVDDAEMIEKKLNEPNIEQLQQKVPEEESVSTDIKTSDSQPIDESSSDSTKEETEPKLISEVSTSSEESSSSSDVTDGNSNSPKTDEAQPVDIQEETNITDVTIEKVNVVQPAENSSTSVDNTIQETPTQLTIQPDNYSISDVNSELPQHSPKKASDKSVESTPDKEKEEEEKSPDVEKDITDKIQVDEVTDNTESHVTTDISES